jgi:capsular polysaccharide biosynthesis protein
MDNKWKNWLKKNFKRVVTLLLAAVIVVIRMLTDTTIWNEEDLTKQYNVPVLGAIPQLTSLDKQSGGKE